MTGARKRAAQPPEKPSAPARTAAKSRKIVPSQVVPPAIAEAPARKVPARRAVHAEPPAIDAALGAPERAAPRRAAVAAAPARKPQPARRALRKSEGTGRAPVQTTINPNYAWPFADVERL